MSILSRRRKRRICKKNKSHSRLKSRDFISKSGIGYLNSLDVKSRQYIDKDKKEKVTITLNGVASLKITRQNLKEQPFEHLSFNRAWKGL